jgi:hypothetical protein
MRGQSKDHAAVGLYRCPKGPPWEFRSVTKPHECARFAAVAEKDLPARLAFEKSKENEE